MTVFKGDLAVKIQRGRPTPAARKIGNMLDVVHVVFYGHITFWLLKS